MYQTIGERSDAAELAAAMEWAEEERRERIGRGVALLDAKVPGWVVDRARLSVGSLDRCVLGQVFGNFDRGLQVLGLTWSQGDRYGFVSDGWEDYADLTESWRAVLDPDADEAGL
jgi:hypothetical protein